MPNDSHTSLTCTRCGALAGAFMLIGNVLEPVHNPRDDLNDDALP